MTSPTPSTPKIVVLGVGNLLLSDEGVGVHCISALAANYEFPENVTLVDGGTSTQELLGDLEDLDHLIVVDAVAAGLAPGSLIRLEGRDVPSAFTTKLSPHQIGIADLLATLTFLGRAPKHLVLHGVEPADLSLGMELTPTLSKIFDTLCQRVLAELDALGFSALPRNPPRLAAGSR